MMMVVKAILLSLGLAWASLLHAQDPIAQANQLISEGKNQEAFELLELAGVHTGAGTCSRGKPRQ